MHRLGMTVLVSHPQSPAIGEQFALYAEAGFDSVFIGSGTVSEPERLIGLSDAAARCGIWLEAFHAPSDRLDALWGAEEKPAEAALRQLCDVADVCHAAGIEKLVLHTACGSVSVTAEALHRFSRLEAYAEARGVILCYENGSVLPPLIAVLQNASPFHGFCFDAGHQQCYCPGAALTETFGQRMRYTHLHDNSGRGDEHLLPFDGVRDWAALAGMLVAADYRGTLNLELACHSAPAYRALPFDVFVREAHARLVRFADLMDRP